MLCLQVVSMSYCLWLATNLAQSFRGIHHHCCSPPPLAYPLKKKKFQVNKTPKEAAEKDLLLELKDTPPEERVLSLALA